MLSQNLRAAILELHRKGVGTRPIARALQISRGAVKKVIRSQSTDVPPITRAERAEPYRQRILDLYACCQGNLVRVHEELLAEGAQLSYPTLTAFCRRQDIGQKPKLPAGQYHFAPGEEMHYVLSFFMFWVLIFFLLPSLEER